MQACLPDALIIYAVIIGYLSLWEILVVMWPCVRLIIVRSTWQPIWNLTLSSYSEGAFKMMLHLHVVINWQLSKYGIPWPYICIAGSGVEVFEVIHWQVTSFKLIAGSTPSWFLCNGYNFIFEVNNTFTFWINLGLSIRTDLCFCA